MPKSDSARKPKLKLPKVWVVLGGPQPHYAFVSKFAADAEVSTDFEIVHPYAPVQPPRRCVWTEVTNGMDGFNTACGQWVPGVADIGWRLCGHCGGRIVRRTR